VVVVMCNIYIYIYIHIYIHTHTHIYIKGCDTHIYTHIYTPTPTHKRAKKESIQGWARREHEKEEAQSEKSSRGGGKRRHCRGSTERKREREQQAERKDGRKRARKEREGPSISVHLCTIPPSLPPIKIRTKTEQQHVTHKDRCNDGRREREAITTQNIVNFQHIFQLL
jgi:hypothetical protein